MEIIITVRTDNAAFEDYPAGELSRILSDLARQVRRDHDLQNLDGKRLYDANGNRIGSITVVQE